MTSLPRRTFAQLAEPTHPDAARFAFTPRGGKREPDRLDREIAGEIAAIIGRAAAMFGGSDGEWTYLDQRKRNRYIDRITQPGVTAEELAPLFADMFRNDSTYGVVTPSFADVDEAKVRNQILLDLDTCREFAGPLDLRELLFDGALGNPFGLAMGGAILAPDTPRHYFFARRTAEMLSRSRIDDPGVVEIGAGYGGMPLLLSRMTQGLRYLCIDLFETCLLQYYFLRKAGADARFVLDPADLGGGAGVSIAPAQIAGPLLRAFGGVSVVFNSRSFSEMGRATIDAYFRWIQDDVRPELIYHENSNFLLFPDSVRHVEIVGSDFPVDGARYRLAEMNVSRFLGGSGRYREFLYERR